MMIVGKKYEIHINKNEVFRPQLQAAGIVECVEDMGNGFYKVKKDDDGSFWLIDYNTKYSEVK